MAEFNLIAIFFVGFLGGVHCIGMCGGIVGMFTSQLPDGKTQWRYHLAYSAGRITSYAIAGALVGGIGQAGLLLRDVIPMQLLFFTLSSLMLIALGLYLSGIWGVVRHIEQLGSLLWRHIQPYTKRLLPVNTLPRALGLGALWGFLPCGLVYSVLIAALASGSEQHGALIMLAFGLGTLPNLLAIGLFWDKCQQSIRSPKIRMVAGLLVLSLGLYGLFKASYIFATLGWEGSCHVNA